MKDFQKQFELKDNMDKALIETRNKYTDPLMQDILKGYTFALCVD